MEKCFGLLRLAAMVVALLVFPPLVSSADIAVGTTTEQGVIRSTVKFDSGDAINAISRAIPSCPTMTVTFFQDNASQVTLYETDPNDDTFTAVEASTLVVAYTGTSTASRTFRPGKQFVRFVVDTAETSGSSSAIVNCINSVAGGGSTVDNDGDGLFEFAYLQDWDGDGSTYVTCTAKDAPDPACKVAGEVIYRDFADDANCGMHGCGFGKMEDTGVIKLRDAVSYLLWPCYDAREPDDFNDPTALDDSLHDNISDPAYYRDCPATPDPNTDRRFMGLAFMGWQGTIEGSGRDLRNPASTAGYKRDIGTYIIDDRGPAAEEQSFNIWFGANGHVRGLNFGFASAANATSNAPSQSGENVTDGDSKGWGDVVGTQQITALDAQVCVSNTSVAGSVSADNWATSLRAGDIVIVRGTSMTTGDQARVNFAMRVRDTPAAAAGCNGTGQVYIPLGGQINGGTLASDWGTNPPLVRNLPDNALIMSARSDYSNAGGTMRNLTVQPQDWWNEGADCAETGIWSISGDQAATDYDCDTNALFGAWGGGRILVEDVAVLNWHDRAVDGAANWGYADFKGLDFRYGNGGPIADPNFGIRLYDTEVHDSHFSTNVLDTFGPGIQVDGMTVVNSTFQYLYGIGAGSRYGHYAKTRILGSAFGHVIAASCGAEFNEFSDIVVSGNYTNGNFEQNGKIARFACADEANPIKFNTISSVRLEGPGAATAGTGITSCAVVLDTNSGAAVDNTSVIRDNTFSNINYLHQSTANYVGLFCNQDDTATSGPRPDPDVGHRVAQNVLWKNTFTNSTLAYDGATGAASRWSLFATCGFYQGVHICNDPILTDADSSVVNNANGCGNMESGLVGSTYVIQRPLTSTCE